MICLRNFLAHTKGRRPAKGNRQNPLRRPHIIKSDLPMQTLSLIQPTWILPMSRQSEPDPTYLMSNEHIGMFNHLYPIRREIENSFIQMLLVRR
jgi:hypothetical protein